MARARLEIGGKYQNQIVFRGNRQHLPPLLRAVITSYFDNWGGLKDIAQYPELLGALGDAGEARIFPDTDWEQLNALYQAHMLRFTLILDGLLDGGAPRFRVVVPDAKPVQSLTRILREYATPEGVLHDSFDLWCVEKLFRRAGAKLKSGPRFVPALKLFGLKAVSLEESLSFYRQIQAYHAEQFLQPELGAILAQYIDAVHTLRRPTALPELAEKLRKAGAELRIHPSVDAVLDHYTALERAAAPLTDDARATSGTPADPRVAAELAGVLRTTLYPFQREGVAFLTVNKRALLADDMGLGKTLQAIAGALWLKRRAGLKRALVVCPASLKYQWQAEIHRFCGERCVVIEGNRAERTALYTAAASRGTLLAADERPLFYVVNYELVYRDIEQLQELGAELLILDEAQRVKNFRTKTAEAVLKLPAPYLFILTGTPLENQLMELYTIMRFIDERPLGRNPVAFRDRYVITDRFGGITGYQHVEEVTRKIASLTLRRTREQALDQLPPLTETNVPLELTDVQRQIYRELQGQARSLLSDTAWDAAKTNNALTLLQRLREVCDTSELIDPQFKESQKLSELISRLDDEVRTLDRQVLIFTQWTRMGQILVRELNAAGLAPSFLHGGLDAQQRHELVTRFNAGQDRVFISTDAGGLGLNLQAASLVVNYDLPFNPAKLSQRIARAHRMGQRQAVFVINLLCRNTVEEKLVRILKEKQELFNDVFGEISDPSLAKPQAGQQRTLRELLAELLG